MSTSVINEAELARQTRQILNRLRQESPLIVESSGQAEAAILDILDYRLLCAAAIHLAQPLSVQAVSLHDPASIPRGLRDQEVEEALEQYGIQAAWNLVIGATLDCDISLARAAELLHLSRWELSERFHRHGIPLPMEDMTAETLLAEVEVLLR